jgi:serine/threonine protein kinase
MPQPPLREEQLVAAALQLATREERSAFLKGACLGDSALLQRVEALLHAHEQADDSFDLDLTIKSAPIPDRPVIEPLTEKPGDRIGRYKLLQQIGEGGMSSVWMAEQEEPVRRRVALKFIKLGMDTKQFIARFEAERQALALMDHPNIAKVLDAGATDTGRPFFVMELVRGVPITEYCDQNSLSARERLDLFLPVCRAIQHAHQKGIIHRDIKPSNIMVMLADGVPVPKVIDFGIAKAIDQPLTEKTLFTRFEQFIGTPAYMSPEQAGLSGLDIDTRSDVYALGVLLYELLTGKTPFDTDKLAKAGLDVIRQIIREEEPPRPSTRLSTLAAAELATVAKRRHSEPPKLIHLLRGDLDWIVMKTLEKDRTRRYETANGLAMDLQRYLDNEPIIARPPSSIYRFRKLVRRNKLAVGAAAAVVVAILAGLALATVGLFRANYERQRAVAALAEAQQQRALADDNFRQARAAVEDLLKISDERLKDQPGLQPLRIELMKAAIDRYEPFLAKPIPDPTPRQELARLYARYGLLTLELTEVLDEKVMAEFEKARKLQEQLLKEHPGDRSLRADLGWTLILEEWRQHNFAPTSQQAGKQAVEIFRSLVAENPTDPFARDDLVWADWRLAETVDRNEGLVLINDAVANAEQLVREYPASAEFRRDLANALSVKSIILPGLSFGPQTPGKMNPVSVPLTLGEAIQIGRRAVELDEAVLADLKSNRPEARLPKRPDGDQARMVGDSPMWAEADIAWQSEGVATLYQAQSDWRAVADMQNQAISHFKDLVEHNPSVATFGLSLVDAFQHRVKAAKHENDRQQAAAWSKDAVAFWNRLFELHPDLPVLKTYADDAMKKDAEVAQWLAQAPSTQP